MANGAHPNATNHFNKLNTTTMEGPASDAIQFADPGTYTAAGKTCSLTCHIDSETHNNRAW
jgi:hypothetical protein